MMTMIYISVVVWFFFGNLMGICYCTYKAWEYIEDREDRKENK